MTTRRTSWTSKAGRALPLLPLILTAAAVALIVGSSTLPSVIPLPDGLRNGDGRDGSAAGAGAAARRALGTEDLLRDLLANAGLPEGSLAATVLGQHGTPAGMPHSLGDLVGHAGASHLDRLPVPEAPSGPEPLLDALRAYTTRTGAAMPDADLRPAIAVLQLSRDTEGAIARLVLAYLTALDLQEQAMAGLSAEERLLAQGDPGQIASWLASHPEAGIDGLEARLGELSRTIDGDRMLQAADLLARTVDAVRVPLSRVPAVPPTLSGSGLGASEAATDVWSVARDLLAAHDGDARPVAAPPASLAEALRDLLAAYGLPPSLLPEGAVSLPPSLDKAIAGLVQAQAAGIRSGDAAVHAVAILDAAERAEPVLQAWNALLQPSSQAHSIDQRSLVASLLTPGVTHATLVGQALGTPLPRQAPAHVPDLAALLVEQGMASEEAAVAASGLPPPAAGALGLLLEARAGLADALAQATEPLDPTARAALVETAGRTALLAQPEWTPEEAEAVLEWADAWAAVAPESLDAIRKSQANAAWAAQQAMALLSVPASAPLGIGALEEMEANASDEGAEGSSGPGAPAMGLSAAVAPCVDSDFSDCSRDVYLALGGVAGGIVVTGEGSTRIDTSLLGGAPQITIDLGGDDEYLVPAGAAQVGLGLQVDPVTIPPVTIPVPATPYEQEAPETFAAATGAMFGVALDAGGNDIYTSNARVAQGAALGLAAVGILWDRAGDDRYVQERGAEDAAQYAQGFGGFGGLGLLVDEAGEDEYAAAESLAQGVGLAPFVHYFASGSSAPFLADEVGGAGLLVDLGKGSDSYFARAGQGHGSGYGTVGILLDTEGVSDYEVSATDHAYQGGRGAVAMLTVGAASASHNVGGLAALVDLGGAGDTYTGPSFAADGLSADHGTLLLRSIGSTDLRRQDDSIWANLTFAASVGIDSSLTDEDGDGFPSIVELLAFTDPHDRFDSPATEGWQDRPVAALQQAVDQVVATVTDVDRDGDGFANVLETTMGSDPDDPESTPQDAVSGAGILFDTPLLCPASSADACRGQAPACDSADPGMGCMSIVRLGSDAPTTHDRPALLQVDLGGDDTYTAAVAGPGLVRLDETETVGFGSTSIDLNGDDAYETPGSRLTQAATEAGASLLIDLDGADRYSADSESQAFVRGQGVALLLDRAGDDTYAAGPDSQGAVTSAPVGTDAGGRLAALLDLGGDDHYTFVSQGTVTGSVSTNSAAAVVLDLGGADHYTSRAPPNQLATPFASQGRVQVEGSVASIFSAAGLFADLGPEADLYHTLGSDGELVDVTATKDGAGLVANQVRAPFNSAGHAAAWFLDGPASLKEDSDGDGTSNLGEFLAGTDPRDPDESPVNSAAGVLATPNADVLGSISTLGYLRLPGLAIGLPIDNVYHEDVGFLIDLGGNDAYLAPHAGGTFIARDGLARQQATPQQAPPLVMAGAVSLLLDLAGDDTYAPADCVVEPPTFEGDAFTKESPSAFPSYGDGSLGASATTADQSAALAYTLCPSLGGAANGVAVLADLGGSNRFEARTRVAVTARSDADANAAVKTWGVTQGASLFGGVGLLATWNSSSEFTAHVDVFAEEQDNVASTPSADAVGLAQGAAYGYGTGILAAFGTGDDTYATHTSATAPRGSRDGGRAMDLAQGAAEGGTGILLDEGGRNRFTAPSGHAQGYGRLAAGDFPPNNNPSDARRTQVPLGLLWSGPGDDTYFGSDASQGSAGLGDVGLQALGVLVDGGGNDHYLLAPAREARRVRDLACAVAAETSPACALSQGAAIGVGSGILLDLAGSDRYEASGRTHVQGASLGGYGRLIDLGGDDVYVAAAKSQAYVGAGPVGEPLVIPGLIQDVGFDDGIPVYTGVRVPTGLLADLNGRDAYTLGADGQGFVATDATAGSLATFVDGGGQDRYRYGGSKGNLAAIPLGPLGQDNNWAWQMDPPPLDKAGIGVDAATLDQALVAYREAQKLGVPVDDLGTVELTVSRNAARTQLVEDDDPANGTLVLFADVTSDPRVNVQRVNILEDGGFIGVATPAGQTGAAQTYTFEWSTRSASLGPETVAVADGLHELTATVMLSPAPGNEHFVTSPDGLEIESAPRQIKIDNPPLGKATLSTPDSGLDGAIAPGRHVAVLELDVSEDIAFPEWYTERENKRPGAAVDVTLHRVGSDASFVEVVRGYAPNGTTTPFQLDGFEPNGTAIPDGLYKVRVRLTDEAGTTVLPDMDLLLDTTPPRSLITLPPLANLNNRSGFSGLNVVWTSSDIPTGPDAPDATQVAGVADSDRPGIRIERLLEDGTVVDVHLAGAGAGSFPFQTPPVVSGDVVRLRTVAMDRLGNEEPLGAVVKVGIDFTNPIIEDLQVSSTIAGPGSPLAISAKVTDEPLSVGSTPLLPLVVRVQLNDGVIVDGHPDPNPRLHLSLLGRVNGILEADGLVRHDGASAADPADDLFAVDVNGDGTLSPRDLVLASSDPLRPAGRAIVEDDALVGEGALVDAKVFAVEAGSSDGVYGAGDIVLACDTTDVHASVAGGPYCIVLSGEDAGSVLVADSIDALEGKDLVPLNDAEIAFHDGDDDGAFGGLPGEPAWLVPFGAIEDGDLVPAGSLRLAGGAFGSTVHDGDAAETKTYGTTFTLDAPSTESEDRFTFEVFATDEAGNEASAKGSAFLDARPPLLTLAAPTYFDGPIPTLLGRPGGVAVLEVQAQDQAVDAIVLEVQSLGLDGADAIVCERGSPTWTCTVPLPEAQEEDEWPGHHTAVVLARDSGGNEAEAVTELVVDGRKPQVIDPRVTARGYDFIEITWETDPEATPAVRYHINPFTDTAPGLVASSDVPGTQHVLRITGLQPGTTYYLRPEPRSLANVAADPVDAIENTTLNSFRIHLPGFDPQAIWHGPHEVVVAIEPLTGKSPIAIDLKLRTPDNKSTLSVGGSQQALTAGLHTLGAETRGLPDGIYVLLVEARRGASSGSETFTLQTPAIRLDNTAPALVPGSPAPGGVTPLARPPIELLVVDPLNPNEPPLDSLVLQVDGTTFPAVAPSYSRDAGDLRLRLDLPADLPTGEHVLKVLLSDAAGNVGEAEWSFNVDHAAPALPGTDGSAANITYEPGPDRAKPGGRVHIDLTLEDPAGVGQVTIDLTKIKGPPLALLSMGNGLWSGDFDVPADAPEGTFQVPVASTDGLGNHGNAGDLTLHVDRTAPAFRTATADALSMTSAQVSTITSEPTTLTVATLGRPEILSPRGTLHIIDLSGLRPGERVDLVLTATDGAGHTATTALNVTPPVDTQPPSPPTDLSTSSTMEGLVHLSWAAASDNAGVAHYEVTRVADNGSTILATTNRTEHEDAAAPPGVEVSYAVRTVDIAGLRSAPALSTVKVLALPRLLEASIEPRSGPSDQPFRVHVLYGHPVGATPEGITLMYGDLAFTLVRSGTVEECRVTCAYTAEVLLPARSTLLAKPTVAVVAVTEGQRAEIPLEPPLVLAGADLGVQAGSKDAPAAGLGALAFLVLVAAGLRRVRRRDP